jgi:predicted HicB family RNase H-like nuclease
MKLLTYKGYAGEVEYDPDERILYGRVLDLRDIITFQSESAAEIEEEFQTSVDVYLAFCEEQGIEPAKPFSGKLILRIPPETHRAAVVAAASEHKSLNAWLAAVVERAARDEAMTP